MPVHLRRSLSPTVLLCAALALALLAPVSASASAGGGQSAAKQTIRAQKRAAREAQRDARKQQRAERKDAKQAAHEATRGERQAEREARRAAREAERSDRPSTTEAPTSTEGSSGEPNPGETGQTAPAETTPQAPPSGTGAQPSLAPRSGCTLTVAPSAAQVTVGETVTLSGKLSCPAGIDVAGREVTIDQREASAPAGVSAPPGVSAPLTSLAPVDTATTAEDGSYEFHSAALTGRSTFVVRSAGVRHPARTVVRVGAGMTLEGSIASGAALALSAGRGAAAANRLSFSGVVQPVAAGVGVGLRVRYAGSEWRTVAFAHTDANGDYSFSHRFRTAGTVEVVTVSHPHGEQRTESTPLSYTITTATSPAPTSTTLTAPVTPAPTSTSPVTPAPTSPTTSPTPGAPAS